MEGHGRWRTLVGEEGIGGPVGQENWTRSGLLLRRGSSVEVDDPSDGGEGGRMEALCRNPGRRGGRKRQAVAAVVAAVAAAGAGIAAIAATGGVTALWAAICSLASFRSFLRIRIWSCIVLTRHSILESVCSSRIFSIRRAAATTSSIVGCPSLCTSAAKVRSRAPKKASTA